MRRRSSARTPRRRTGRCAASPPVSACSSSPSSSSTHDTTDDLTATAPSLKTGSGNVLLQTPVAIFGVQPYVTTGAGFYSETLGPRTDRGLGYNTGGGVKISLVGPLRLRVDYRVFKLGSGALYSPAHRVYAGLNLKF